MRMLHREIRIVLAICAMALGGAAQAGEKDDRVWQENFALDKVTHLTSGKNRYFILEPGYQIVLESQTTKVYVTVLHDTVKVNGIETRVVEEREFENGKLKEISRNFFTIGKENKDVYYHGEEVDDYKDGKIVGHGGAWRAGEQGARAGLMMPGKPAVGMRHYQEVAPKVAMDRAEIVSDKETLQACGKKYKDCLKVVETTPLEAGDSIKMYAPGIGLVFDDGMEIVEHGKDRLPPQEPGAKAEPAAGAKAEPAKAPAPAVNEELVAEKDLPKAVGEAVRKLYPKGEIREIKRETPAGGQAIYAFEIIVDGQQYDVETTPEGKVLRNQKE